MAVYFSLSLKNNDLNVYFCLYAGMKLILRKSVKLRQLSL